MISFELHGAGESPGLLSLSLCFPWWRPIQVGVTGEAQRGGTKLGGGGCGQLWRWGACAERGRDVGEGDREEHGLLHVHTHVYPRAH